MLNHSRLMAFVPTLGFEKARACYEGKLGLPLSAENPFALTFSANGVALRLTIAPSFEPLPFTLVGGDVDDIESIIEGLEERDIGLLQFDGIPRDEKGIWSTPNGAKIAWFKDPDGNTLSITENPS